MADHEAHLDHHHDDHHESPDAHATRRAVLQAAIGAGAGAAILSTLYIGAGLVPKKIVTPDREPITAGDILVYSQGDKKDQPINPADLAVGTGDVLAYPMNPETKVIKGTENKNTVLVVKLDPAKLSADTAKLAADGVVVYSAICKHLGCAVSLWNADKQVMLCPCHGAQYDPADGGKNLVVAPKPLGQFPVKVENNQIIINGEPTHPIGVEAANPKGPRLV